MRILRRRGVKKKSTNKILQKNYPKNPPIKSSKKSTYKFTLKILNADVASGRVGGTGWRAGRAGGGGGWADERAGRAGGQPVGWSGLAGRRSMGSSFRGDLVRITLGHFGSTNSFRV